MNQARSGEIKMILHGDEDAESIDAREMLRFAVQIDDAGGWAGKPLDCAALSDCGKPA
ncbi:MAG TPA: hypothetical protein VGZ73_02305 [Bryobacteraceae bacterium]|jgi:hypothetical protein|nr:hypothetical protein [Bryobacteraceae bacterium]